MAFDKVWANALGFGCKIKLVQVRVYKSALSMGQFDLTGGDDEIMAPLSDHGDEEDVELAQANAHLNEMRRGTVDMVIEATA